MARILIVDDQKISRVTLAAILGEAGHTVRAEASGPDALEVARTWLPDVVVLDVHMPGMDGFEVVARLKEDVVTEAIPVVFLTGEPPTDELIVRGLDLGAYDFVSKGCSKSELLARVSVMERIKRGHDELAAIARIGDALLRSVEPDEVAREFVREAARVFRADAMVLAVERHGEERLRVARGLEDMNEASLTRMLEGVVGALEPGDAATSRILETSDVAALITPFVGQPVRSVGVASVRRGPSAALVLTLAGGERVYREDVDGPLLRSLTSQAAIALEHALLNERARVQARELERAINERSRFFASLSHELRTPINAVIGYNHLLRERVFGELNEQQSDALDKANRSAQHLLELVDDILDISKIEAGKLEIYPETVDLADLLRDTATSVQLQARNKGIELGIDVPGNTEVRTDPARVRQIVLNLLSNAVKFTERGSVDLRLRAADDGGAVVAVRDTGPGIATEDLERIFEEFEQGSAAPGTSGTGLGLAISRRLAELLGGELTVDSEPNKGSTFLLTLPAASDDGGPAS